jgi:hypothetical protein
LIKKRRIQLLQGYSNMAQYGAIKNGSKEFNDSESNLHHLPTNTCTKVPARSGSRTISIFALIAGIFLLFSGLGTYTIANKG